MMARQSLGIIGAGLISLMVFAGGCERSEPVSSISQPKVNSSVQIEATEEPQVARAVVPARQPSVMQIDQQSHEFPPARLMVEPRSSGVNAILYSDDPPEAIRRDYTGNSFYLQMELDIPEAGAIGRAVWDYRARTAQPTDSPMGIFLEGRKYQLQPLAAQARFERLEDQTMIWLNGTFVMFNPDEDRSVFRTVPISAVMPVEIDRRR